MNLPNVPHWVHVCLSYLLSGVPAKILLTPALFKHLRRRGIPVWFLAVNSVKHLRMAESLGATAVLTDHPQWLSNTLKEENIQFSAIDQF